MRQRLIDVVEVDALWRVVKKYRLQTGDVTQERGSRQATEHEHCVILARELPQVYRPAIAVNDCQIGDHVANLGCVGKSQLWTNHAWRRLAAHTHTGAHTGAHTGLRLRDARAEQRGAN